MNKEKLFSYLKKQKSSELINLLNKCYGCMKTRDIRNVFGHLENKIIVEKPENDGKTLLKLVKKFKKDSLQGVYYAPFDINSKNFMDIPEETDIWFEKLGDFLIESSKLSDQGDHENSVECFSILFELIDKLDEEIVFADELGIWMLPVRQEPCIRAYFKSAATILNPEEYANAVLPVILQDSYSSFCNKAYEKAKRVANKTQKIVLDEKIAHFKVRIAQNKK